MSMSLEQRRVTPVGETMTTDVVVATPEDRLIEVARAMREHHVSGVPVVTPGREVIGIVSERDLVRELHRSAGLLSFRGILDLLLAFDGTEPVERIRQSLEHLHSARASDVMAKKPVVVAPDDTLQECLRLMSQYAINRLPVVDNGRLVGIVTRGDVMSALAEVSNTKPTEAARAIPGTEHHAAPRLTPSRAR
jgi:CBS domain-containing protein